MSEVGDRPGSFRVAGAGLSAAWEDLVAVAALPEACDDWLALTQAAAMSAALNDSEARTFSEQARLLSRGGVDVFNGS